MPLLDAAVAGVILGFRPSDREMRTQAQRCWEILKPRLNQHLLSEDETVLPWAEGCRAAFLGRSWIESRRATAKCAR